MLPLECLSLLGVLGSAVLVDTVGATLGAVVRFGDACSSMTAGSRARFRDVLACADDGDAHLSDVRGVLIVRRARGPSGGLLTRSRLLCGMGGWRSDGDSRSDDVGVIGLVRPCG